MPRRQPSSRRALLPGLLLGLLAVGAAVAVLFLVLDAPGSDGGGGRAAVGSEATSTAPGQATELPPAAGATAAEPEPLKAQAPPSQGPAALLDSVDPALRGRVGGTLRRAADRSPLAGGGLRAGPVAGASDAEGRFELPGVLLSETALMVLWPDGAIMVELPERTGDLLDLELIVPTGWIVTGRVVDEGGVPLADTEVRLIKSDGSVGREVVTARDGRFLFADVSPERTLLEAWRSDRERVRRTISREDVKGQGLEVELVLAAGGSLAGEIRDASGSPVPGATVVLPFRLRDGWIEDAGLGLSAVSDEHGAYRIDGVPAGTWIGLLLSEPPPEGAAASHPHRAWPSLRAAAPELLVVAGSSTRLDWSWPEPAEAAGQVLTPEGLPAADAQVEVTQVIELASAPRPGSFSAKLRGAVARADGTGRLTLSLRILQTAADAAGGFALAPLPPGEVVLRAAAPEHDQASERFRRLASEPTGLSAGERLEELAAQAAAGPNWAAVEQTLHLSPGVRHDRLLLTLGTGLTIRGRILDEQGQPLVEAYVLIVEESDTVGDDGSGFGGVDGEGRFELRGFPPGRYTIVCGAPGHHDRLETVEAGGPEVTVVLGGSPTLSGTVSAADTGEPVWNFHLRLEDDDLFYEREIMDSHGAFRLDSLGEGLYTLTVTATGFLPEVRRGLDLRTGQPLHLELRLLRQ